MSGSGAELETRPRHELTIADTRRGGKRSGESRRARILERADRQAMVGRIIDGVENDNLPGLFAGLSVQLALAIVRGEGVPEAESAEDVLRLATAADKLHKMARLAGGQSTSNAASINVDGTELAGLLRSRLAQLSKDPTNAPTPPLPVPPTDC